jgi:ParB/Sulfiredoxin domain
MIAGRTIHPAADLLPLMRGDDLQTLADDIAEHGLREPIWLDKDGQILDGRNRALACKVAGVEPEFQTYKNDDPVAFVVSQNLHRRQLSTSQKGMVAVCLEEPLAIETKARNRTKAAKQQGADGRFGRISEESDTRSASAPPSVEIAAKAVGVSPSQVTRAKHIAKKDPEAADRIRRGESTVGAEYKRLQEKDGAPPDPSLGNVGDLRCIPKRPKTGLPRFQRAVERMESLADLLSEATLTDEELAQIEKSFKAGLSRLRRALKLATRKGE